MRKNKRRSYKKDRLFYKIFILTLLGIVMLASIYVWQRIEVVRLSKKIGDLKNQMEEEQKLCKYLSLEIAGLTRGDWIEKIAINQLDMEYSSLNQIQWIASKELDGKEAVAKKETQLAQKIAKKDNLVLQKINFSTNRTDSKNEF